MSGRAYARNPSGALGGATDINSIIPHRFCLAAPVVANRVKDLAIRRVIQQRCKEKNWKKLLQRRHTRLLPLVTPVEEVDGSLPNGAYTEEPAASTTGVDAGAAEQQSHKHTNGTLPEVAPKQTEAGEPAVEESHATAVAIDKAKEESISAKQAQQEELERTKRQLQELEEKLSTLSAQKHEKFLQLKDILIAEARSKTSTSSAAPSVKKRRLEAPGSTTISPRVTGAPSGASTPAGTDHTPAGPSPSLLRAQSFSGSRSFPESAPDLTRMRSDAA